MTTLLRVMLFCCLVSLINPVFAQKYNVKGSVCDSIGNPESFVTVKIYMLPDTVNTKITGVSGDDGIFDLPIPEAGSYRVNILSLGKSGTVRDISVSEESPTADLGVVILSDSSNTLEEVTVTAQRPLVTKEIDRIGYDVQADTDSKTSQLDEILKKVPFVSVDPDGTIKIKGSTDFKVYKNGRPNNSFSRNAKEIFKALPASMIKRIEVITDPGSREDAEGTAAILNIVTMENTIIKGVMGSISLNYRYTNEIPTPSLWLSTQIDKITVSAYCGYQKLSKRQECSRSENFTKYEDSGNELYSSSRGEGQGDLGYFGLEGSYEPDTLNLITAELSGYTYNMNYQSHGTSLMNGPEGNMLYSYSWDSNVTPTRYLDFDGGLNYQRSTRKKGETITLSYKISSTDQHQHDLTEYNDEVNMPVPYTGSTNDFTLDFIEQTAQLDWTRPINAANKFDVGLKYIHRNNHSINDQDYYNWKTSHSDFKHLTQVFAGYFDYRLKWRKIGARAGLRYEYSRLSAKYLDGSADPFSSNLNDWVPNAALSYDINDANTIKLSYSTRINRPGISQLNPAVVSSPTSISSGNPDLASSRHQSININYNLIGKKLSLDLGTSYSFTNNAIISVQELLENDITKSWYDNSGKNRWFNVSVWTNYSPFKKTSLMLNMNLNYSYSSNPSLKIKTSGWGGYAYFRLRQQLPWKLTLTPYISTFISTPALYSSKKFSASDDINYGIDLQRSFLKENRLSVSVGISKPFGKNPRIWKTTPKNNGRSGYSISYMDYSANIFSCRVSYRFGSLNAQVKKTASSIKNDDVENRRN